MRREQKKRWLRAKYIAVEQTARAHRAQRLPVDAFIAVTCIGLIEMVEPQRNAERKQQYDEYQRHDALTRIRLADAAVHIAFDRRSRFHAAVATTDQSCPLWTAERVRP